MATAIERRRSRFLQALAVTKQSQAAWAREQGISPAHLCLVLTGKRESDRLGAKIDAFAKANVQASAARAS